MRVLDPIGAERYKKLRNCETFTNSVTRACECGTFWSRPFATPATLMTQHGLFSERPSSRGLVVTMQQAMPPTMTIALTEPTARPRGARVQTC